MSPRPSIRMCSHHDDTDFYADFTLDDIGDPTNEGLRCLRNIAQRAVGKGWPVVLGVFRGQRFLEIEMPAGEETRVLCVTDRRAVEVGDMPFDDCEYLENYDGFWCRRTDVVEARVEWSDQRGLFRYAFRDPPANQMSVRDSATGAVLRFGPPSPAAQSLLDIDGRSDLAFTLSLTGARLVNGVAASQKLHDLGRTFLFTLGLNDGYAAALMPIRRRTEYVEPTPDRYQWQLPLEFPRRRLRPETVDLFHYAATIRYPSLRFLAYYQVIEFHFPKYSHLAIDSVRSLLVSPDVDPTARRNLGLVLDHAPTPSRRGWGPERTQLTATLAYSVDPAQLAGLLASGPPPTLGHRLADPNRIRGVTSIDRGASGEQLLRLAGERIYGVRNRIVHAKENIDVRDAEPLFPFSPEADALDSDIELSRFLAAAVLIAAAEEVA